MTTLSHSYSHEFATERESAATNLLAEIGGFLRRSRALASMVPALTVSGLLMLAFTGMFQLTAIGSAEGMLSAWMESWLTAWSIAFPIAYVTGPALLKFAAYVSDAIDDDAASESGLAFRDIASVSARVTQRNSFTVLRNLKVREDYRA